MSDRITADNKSELLTFCETHNACSDGRDWAVAAGCETLAQAWAKCQRSDWMIWMLRQAKLLDKPAWARVTVEFAADVLPIFEARYPDKSAPRMAIEAARAWLADPPEDNRAAADAGWAADAAGCAAAAAGWAAAADAAGWAAAAAARLHKRAEQADMLRAILGNPFEQESDPPAPIPVDTPALQAFPVPKDKPDNIKPTEYKGA